MELCHFHVPSVETSGLDDLRTSLRDAGVALQTLLIDDGDVSDPQNGQRDADWISEWIDVAASLGATYARVIGGKEIYSPEAFDRAAAHLDKISRYAESVGVRAITENWFSLLDSPEAVLRMLDHCQGRLGLCVDMGNWSAPAKYADLPLIFPRGDTCHAKCDFLSPDEIDMDDYGQCLSIARESGYSGSFVLVNGGPEDDWHALDLSKAAILG